jgi:hypothetical protein
MGKRKTLAKIVAALLSLFVVSAITSELLLVMSTKEFTSGIARYIISNVLTDETISMITTACTKVDKVEVFRHERYNVTFYIYCNQTFSKEDVIDSLSAQFGELMYNYTPENCTGVISCIKAGKLEILLSKHGHEFAEFLKLFSIAMIVLLSLLTVALAGIDGIKYVARSIFITSLFGFLSNYFSMYVADFYITSDISFLKAIVANIIAFANEKTAMFLVVGAALELVYRIAVMWRKRHREEEVEEIIV